MRVFVMWQGGLGYGQPYQWDDLEEFPSMGEAKNEHWRREHDHEGTTRRVGKEPERVDFPCVEHSRSDVYLYDPREVHDAMPDRVIMLGPRGGVRVRLPSEVDDD